MIIRLDSTDCTQALLLWLIIIFSAGTLITGKIQMVISGFFFDKDGNRFSNMQLQFCFSQNKYRLLLDNIDDKMKGSIRKCLRVDYLFMFFLYILMIALALYIPMAATAYMDEIWERVFQVMIWLTVIVWIFDILENILTVKNLQQFEVLNGFFQLICTVLKFTAGAIYLLWLLAFLTGLLLHVIF